MCRVTGGEPLPPRRSETQVPKYVLNYYVIDQPLDPHAQYRGRGWWVGFEPARKYLTDCPVYRSYKDKRGRRRQTPAKLVVIRTTSWLDAMKAGRLITAVECVLHGSSQIHDVPDLLPYPADSQEKAPLDERTLDVVRGSGASSSNMQAACQIAAKASYRNARVHAIFKLLWSYRLYSTWWVDLDPDLSGEILPKGQTPEEQVAFAHAIVLAYAAIEELGLEVRTSSDRPSRPDGKWNPEVRAELERRLAKSNIKISAPTLWNLRGRRTRLEQDRPTYPVGRAAWSGGLVRDQQVHICDAIADVSWLRSWVAAHKSGELVKLLSPYDVDNAQHLARRLILESMGFWPPWRKVGE